MQKTSLFVFAAILLLSGCLSPLAISAVNPPTGTFSFPEVGVVNYQKAVRVDTIGVYLPPCYDPNGRTLYPALYLLPGFGGSEREWLDIGLPELTDQLVLSGKISALIIVTTGNTYDGIDPKRIVKYLIPYIESHFRVISGRARRAITGCSLGGGTAYVLVFQHPDLFSSAGVFGTSLTNSQEDLDDVWLQAIPPAIKPLIFLNTGEQDTYILQQAKALIPLLDNYQLEHTEIFSPGGHEDRYWLSNFPAYFQWLSEDW
jgi:enterochelin esterase-like enzyme